MQPLAGCTLDGTLESVSRIGVDMYPMADVKVGERQFVMERERGVVDPT